jgi:inosine-uridine nucleoside N-ribohydrolase
VRICEHHARPRWGSPETSSRERGGNRRHMRTAGTAWRVTAPLAVAVIAALWAPMTVYAAAWHRLYTTADRSVDIELSATHRQGDVVLAWVRFSFVKDQRDPSARSYR